ncbi:MAG: type VI secretion system tube protein Hcp [Alphaproteobacteria bacterium]|nr:MAG: type VI secretion system tube protein Hcp [Alphaproteobacteria bacterium]
MAIFMLYEGITGEHAVAEQSGFIKLDSTGWGMVRGNSSVPPALRSRNEPSITEVTCTKATDGSSIALLIEGLTGRFDRTVTINFMRQGTGTVLTYLSYKLFDCGISSFHQNGPGDGAPMESFSLNFTAIEVTHTVFQDDFTGVPSNVFYSIPDAQ